MLYFGGPVTQYPTDPALRRYIVSRYNDWMVELSQAAPTRLIGLGHVALVDIDEAVAELERIATRGLRGFHCDPYPDERGGKALWDPGYEPFWSAVAATGLPMSFHIVAPRKVDLRATFLSPVPGVKENLIALTPIGICEVVSTLARNWQIVLLGMLLVGMTTISFYTITVYTPTFGKSVLKLAKAVCRADLYDAALDAPGGPSPAEPADGIGAFAGPAFDPDDIEAHLAAFDIKREPAG